MKPFDMVKNIACALLVFGVVLSCTSMVRAEDIPGYPDGVEAYDPRELNLLPPYCIHTMLFRDAIPGANDPAKVSKWRNAMGSGNFDTMHHYCWGLMKTNRGVLLARDQQTRLFYLRAAVHEFDYVLQRVAPDFLLLPEVLTKKGENLVRLGKGPLSVAVFERAMEAKPDYWPPYAQLADYYKDIGDLKSAKETLDQGLAAVPDSAPLKRRLAELSTPTKKSTAVVKKSDVKKSDKSPADQ